MASEGSLQKVAAGGFVPLCFVCACLSLPCVSVCGGLVVVSFFCVVVFVVVFHLVFPDVVLHKFVRATPRKKVRPQREGGKFEILSFLCLFFVLGALHFESKQFALRGPLLYSGPACTTQKNPFRANLATAI